MCRVAENDKIMFNYAIDGVGRFHCDNDAVFIKMLDKLCNAMPCITSTTKVYSNQKYAPLTDNPDYALLSQFFDIKD